MRPLDGMPDSFGGASNDGMGGKCDGMGAACEGMGGRLPIGGVGLPWAIDRVTSANAITISVIDRAMLPARFVIAMLKSMPSQP